MDYFLRISLSKFLTDTIEFNKHDINIFINDKWRKYAGGDIGRLFKITRRLELRFLTNGKAKSTFTRRLLRPNCPPT